MTTLEYGLPTSTRDMDVFSITLDTFLDWRNSFIWLVNLNGAYGDGQTSTIAATPITRGVVTAKVTKMFAF